MLKSLAIALAIGVAFGGGAMAQTVRKPMIAVDPIGPLLVDHKEKHKDKHWKHFGQRRDDEDENEGRRRQSTARSWPGYRNPYGNYYGSSRPYYDAPRGYGSYGYGPPRYQDYGASPYYRGY
jgi:hypothetical protein